MSLVSSRSSRSSRSRRTPPGRLICAHLAWVLPLVFTGAGVALAISQGSYHGRPIVPGIISGVGCLAGIGCGIFGLRGISDYRQSRRFMPAVTGISLGAALLLCLALGALALPAIHRSRERAARMRVEHPLGGLHPAVHNPDAQRLSDADVDFSFELPEKFGPFPSEKRPPEYKYAYFKPTPAGISAPMLFVQVLGAVLPPRHLTREQVPPDKNLTLETFDWRGLSVDAVRASKKVGDGEYVTLTVRIPLKKGAIQISFGDLAENERALEQRVEKTLATLEGETNW